MQLTRGLLLQLQDSNQELTKLITPQASGTAGDPRTAEKIGIIQRQFGLKLEQYHLDLADLIGAVNAEKIVAVIHGIIPQALLGKDFTVAGSHDEHGMPTGTVSSPAAGAETPVNPGLNRSDIQGGSSGNPNNGSMNGMVMPGTQNMPNMSSVPNMSGMGIAGMDGINRQILIQLQSSNVMLLQMLTNLSSQAGNGNWQNQIQLIYQILANQSVLLQMLTNRLNNGPGEMSANKPGMGMGMSNMGGMGMMGK